MKSLSKSIVFITGTFIGNNCWGEWKPYFESKGYKCIAPAWPYKDAAPEQLRNSHPDHDIASNTLMGLTDHFASIINMLPEKPILIGHSLGGLVAQLLLQRGSGAAGVAIHSFPPAGISTFQFLFVRTIWEGMAFFTSAEKTYMVSFRKWIRSFANGMTCEQQKELYYKYAIPESKKIIRDVFKCRTKINFKNSHAPLLFLSGSEDKLIQASMNYSNYKKYESYDSVTGYKNFKGRNHLVFEHTEWKEEVEFILYWLQGLNEFN
jgi:pimeloyl-ACP methyl ester carboxylesterase